MLIFSNGNKRIKEIDRNISSLFEKNVSGVISDERFMTMTADYESEQNTLKKSIVEAEEPLSKAEQNAVDVRMLLKGFRRYSEMRDNPAEGKGVALFGLLHIPYLKYFLIHPTGNSAGVFAVHLWKKPQPSLLLFH